MTKTWAEAGRIDTDPATERCEACGSNSGSDFITKSLSYYHGKDVCGVCMKYWKVMERVMGRDVSLEEFRKASKGGRPWKSRKR